ncbi:MAG: 23S rRNA (guanosine(2251)-2'-O)-methyltransferase RlmB [Ruminococcaceae bacterium]|nr:23S rRNA (guanosine(2251)-2'-O)-methyltransferase RlmB [Oscillospiraceae bacterium]
MEKNANNEFVVGGRNAVKELLLSGRDIDKIYVQKGERDGSIRMLVGKAAERKIPIVEAEKSKIDAICDGTHHQGIVAMASEQNYSTIEEIIEYANSLGEAPFVVICDGVEDPHNLGAIIRSAECSGVHGVIIPKRRSVGLTATVAKSAAGATAHMRVARVTNLASTVDELKKLGFWVYAADMGGDEYSSVDYSGSVAVVLGSEGFGISRLVKEKSDFVVSIPLYGKVNSLNVSCAAAVILTEVARQKHKKHL